MRHLSSFVVFASLFLAVHGAAYGDPLKSYTPQTSGGTLITFEGQPEGTRISNQFSGVTFIQPDGGRPMIDTYAPSDSKPNGWLFGYGASSGSAVLTGSTDGGAAAPTIAGIIATFTSPVSVVELFLSDTAPLGNYTIAAFGAGGTLLESFVVPLGTSVPPDYSGGTFPPPGTKPLPGIFVGFVRPSGDIVSIQIGPSDAALDAFAIDDLRFSKIVALNDAYTMNEDAIIDTTAQQQPSVLANDTPGTTAVLVAIPEHGSVTLNANGSFIYTPDPNFNGIDTFFYVAKNDANESSNIATVTITVNAVNDPPFFDPIPDQYVNPPVNENQTVPITGIAAGPPDEADQVVTFTATSNNALVSISGPIITDGSVGTLTYRRTSNATGTATITVMAQDNGGGTTNTFTRTFDVVVGASGTVEANLTGFAPNTNPNKAPTVQVTVTARPIDWNGNGVIDIPGDCYRIFHPQTRRYNIVPSGADRSPEGPPWRLATKDPVTGAVTDPGDTQEICGTARSFTASVDLSEWITRSGEVTTNLDYVSLIRDLECLIDPTQCVQRIWTGVRPVGAITFTGGSGAKVADVNKVILHTTNTVGTTATTVSDTPIGGAVARVFDRNNTAFQNQKFGGTQKIGKNPDGSFYDDIWESQVGQIATCTTPDSGVCIATETQTGDYLVIVKFIDTPNRLAVYDGLPKGVSDFVNGVATKSFTIVKKLQNGIFQQYQAGSKTVVKSCTPAICP
jgi:Bacterial Ig domain